MPKPSTRDAILKEGLRLCLNGSFSAATVRDITRAAGAPLGSFTNHFGSKEAFGLEVLELYRQIWRRRFAKSFLDENISPLEGFRRFFDELRDDQEQYEWKTGCLLGNFSLEAGSLGDDFRTSLREAHTERAKGFAAGLRRAIEAGEISPDIESDETGEFLDEALQGATMRGRVEQSSRAYDRFREYVFATILR